MGEMGEMGEMREKSSTFSPSSPNPFSLRDTAGELEKPNPPAPFPTPLVPPCEEGGQRMLRFFCTEGGASKPLQINKKYYSASLSL